MALVKCKECGQEISQKAGSCPKCGAPIKKKTSVVTWLITGLFVLWLIGSLSSKNTTESTSASSSKSAPVAYKIGDTAHIGYTSYAVWEASYRDQLSNNQFLNQAPDATYLFIDLTVRNDDKQARTIAPFKLVDENGAEYETSSKAWSVEGGIGVLDSLNPAVSKRGYIVFDVPRGKRYKLKITGGYWSSDEALVDLALK